MLQLSEPVAGDREQFLCDLPELHMIGDVDAPGYLTRYVGRGVARHCNWRSSRDSTPNVEFGALGPNYVANDGSLLSPLDPCDLGYYRPILLPTNPIRGVRIRSRQLYSCEIP